MYGGVYVCGWITGRGVDRWREAVTYGENIYNEVIPHCFLPTNLVKLLIT